MGVLHSVMYFPEKVRPSLREASTKEGKVTRHTRGEVLDVEKESTKEGAKRGETAEENPERKRVLSPSSADTP